MSKFKGVGPVFILKYVRKLGLEAQFKSKLSPENWFKLEYTLTSGWVPMEFWTDILEAAALTISGNMDLGLDKIGHDMALDNIKGAYKMFARFFTIAALAPMSPNLWKQYHDQGHAWTDVLGEGRAAFKVADNPTLPMTFLKYNTGYVRGTVDVTGSKNISVILDSSNKDLWVWNIIWAK
jgi:hypothetical protein